ncbi:hypothetical protein MTsPCn5_00020 [Croceitalea sp. MTPC5]|uniref:non-ribosomal peptide synthetase n=1 Tax=Croceitalea sp. MTPC5 TaxID=3056565 RepID=UPI002B3DDEB3|nr:hypothetical protein MTsPCn5_00020 [Croceitalea sp. MTPC5]
MEDIVKFIEEFRSRDGAIWIENNSIRLSTPKDLKNPEVESFIKRNIDKFIPVLTSNKIFSKKDFSNKKILKFSNVNGYPLSYAQQRLWFIEQYEQGTNAYHIPSVYELKPTTNIDGIKYALRKIVDRHEVLRTTIKLGNNEEGIQSVHEIQLPIEEVRLSALDNLESYLKEDINRPFNLEVHYPIRVKFYIIESDKKTVKKNQRRIILLINNHHIATDGWSSEIFQNELYTYYDAYLKKDTKFEMPLPAIQYKDYALWQRFFVAGELLERQLNYWKKRLSGFTNLQFPTDYPRPRVKDYTGGYQNFTLPMNTSDKLRSLAKENGTTLHTVLLSAISILLGKYTGQSDIVVGSPIANRHHRQTQNLIGFFVNTLVNRTYLIKNQSFEELIRQTHLDQVEAQLHQDLPFEKLVDELGVERDPSRHPVFQVSFEVQSFGDGKIRDNTKQKLLNPYRGSHSSGAVKFDLSIYIYENQKQLTGLIHYAASLFEEDTIKRLSSHYIHLLECLTKFPERPYDNISLLRPREFEMLIHKWNHTNEKLPKDKTLLHIFENQAKNKPENIAIVFKGKKLSYRELNQKANQLGLFLRAKYKVRPDDLIGVMMHRSEWYIISILGILKSGAGYVPIDIRHPSERIAHIINDAKLKSLIIQFDSLFDIADLKVDVLSIDLEFEEIASLNSNNVENLEIINSAEDMAYVIYTSGTAGKPKGVMVEHQQILSFVLNNNFIDYNKVDIVAGVSNFAFDGSVFDIFFPLLNGKKLVLVDTGSSFDLSAVESEIMENQVDTIFVTTALFNALVKNHSDCLDNLSQVLFGGELCDSHIINTFKNSYQNTSLIHVYGPTENIVYSSYCLLNEYNTDITVPIGKPLSDKRFYVLDTNGIPVPIGVKGELCIGGAGLARGYLNNKKLTQERFINNPFITDDDKKNGHTRIYKTGDIVRYLKDGNLEFIGRDDDQVKVRGHRIELSEIEHVLSSYDSVERVSAQVREYNGSEKKLIAYFVSRKKENTNELKKYLSERLPSYMLPHFFVQLKEFILTTNGKIDRLAMPNPEGLHITKGVDYIAPRTMAEKQIAKIWKEALKVNKVGIKSNFFNIGGDSIILIQVANRLKRDLEKDVDIQKFYQDPTIEGLAAYFNQNSSHKEKESVTNGIVQKLDALRDEILITLEKSVPVEDIFPMSDIQKGMIFGSLKNPSLGIYHVQLTFNVPSKVISVFRKAFSLLVSKHGILRTGFNLYDFREPVQIVYKQVSYSIDEIDLTQKNEEQKIIQIEKFMQGERKRPFDISKAPLWRSTLFNTGSSYTLLFQFHHALLDGWSDASLITELYNLCIRLSTNPDYVPPLLKCNYKASIVKNLVNKLNEDYIDYWKKEMSDYKRLDIFTNRDTSHTYYKTYDLVYLNRLKSVADQYNISLRNLFLGAYLFSLKLLTPENELTIGLVSNLRPLQEDGDKVLGCFLNTLPFRCHMLSYKDDTWISYFKYIENKYLEIKSKDRISLFEISKKTRENSSNGNPFFDVVFNYIDFHVYNDIEFESEVMSKGNLKIKDFGPTNTYLDLSMITTQQNFIMNYSLRKELKSGYSLEKIAFYLDKVLKYFLEDPEKSFRGISLLAPKEYDTIIHQWNQTLKVDPINETLHQLFCEQAKKTPESTALVFQKKEMSYYDLNEKSDRLAFHIRKKYLHNTGKEMEPDTLIPLCLYRGFEMITAILSVLKAGGAYVPIDPAYPRERINYILKDTNAEILLSQKEVTDNTELELPKSKLINIDFDEDFYQSQNVGVQKVFGKPNDLAYVIYTSGTSGTPKGVMIEHNGICNLIKSLKAKYKTTVSDRFLLFANYVFDGSIEQMFLSLLSGGQLFIIEEKFILDSKSFIDFVTKSRITHLHATPSYLSPINPLELSVVKRVVFGAEYLTKSLFDRYSENITTVINAYGPTEATIISLISINSFLLNNTNIHCIKKYVLNEHLSPVPIGGIGELYIGGAGLARGYLNNKKLTRERFINNPFATEQDRKNGYTRLYKTGDMFRWLPNGELEFIGRKDNQVKIRGYRIELGEVEQALSRVEGIEQTCVLARERKHESVDIKYLVGYFVSTGNKSIEEKVIIKKLSTILPEYMIPNTFIKMESMPLTINGKLDRTALPNPELSLQSENYVEPSTTTELIICRIWQELLHLKLEYISISISFFKLGGHSLNATKMVYEINRILNTKLSLVDVYTHSTVKEIAIEVEKKRKIKLPEEKSIILLNKVTKNDQNFFWIHDGSGDVQSYIGISKSLKRYNSYALRSLVDDSLEPQNINLQSLSNEYVSKIKSIQNCGPYTLGGWSLGGGIAFEIAKQLEQKGDKVEQLIMIDSIVSRSENIAKINLDNERKYVRNLLKGQIEDISGIDSIKDLWQYAYQCLKEESNGLSRIKDCIPNYLKSINPYLNDMTIKKSIVYLNKIRSLNNISFTNDSEIKLKAPLTYIKAQMTDYDMSELINYFLNEVHIHEIQGDHFSIMKNLTEKITRNEIKFQK